MINFQTEQKIAVQTLETSFVQYALTAINDKLKCSPMLIYFNHYFLSLLTLIKNIKTC